MRPRVSGEGQAVPPAGIAVGLHVAAGVAGRMVGAVGGAGAELQAEAGQAEEVLEGHEIGAASQGRELHGRRSRKTGRAPISGSRTSPNTPRAKSWSAGGPPGLEPAREVEVGVHVGHGARPQLRGPLLGVLRRADEAGLLGVPEREHDAAARPPALARERPEGPRQLEDRGPRAARIDAAEGPGVVVRAEEHEAIGLFAATDAPEHVVDGPQTGVHRDVQLDAHGPRPGPIGKVERALEVRRAPCRRDPRAAAGPRHESTAAGIFGSVGASSGRGARAPATAARPGRQRIAVEEPAVLGVAALQRGRPRARALRQAPPPCAKPSSAGSL